MSITDKDHGLGLRLAYGAHADVHEYGKDRVAKLYRIDNGVVVRAMLEREWRALIEATRLGAPAPRAMGLIRLDGRSGIVMERIEGYPIHRLLRLRPLSMIRLAQDAAHIHCSLHSLECASLPQHRDSMTDDISENDLLPTHVRAAMLEWLDEQPLGNRLCHGDLTMHNIMVAPDRVVAVDWPNAGCGRPEADVANSLVTQAATASHMLPRRQLRRIAVAVFNRIYLRAYSIASGISATDIRAWCPYVAARRLRWTVSGERRFLRRVIERQIGH